MRATRTHCKHGHELTPENSLTRLSRGRPYVRCLTCKRATNQEHTTRWRAARPVQYRAHYRVQAAVVAGRLLVGPCAECGAEKVHAHHANGYEGDAVFDVVWLCPKHHSAAHKARSEATEKGAG